MAQLRCTIAEGLRQAEATVTVREHDGSPQFFPLDRGLISHEADFATIPVSLIQQSDDQRFALVGLPVEADSGSHRIWVKMEDLQLLEPVH